MKKKLLILLTIILIVVLIGCLVGCNQTNDEDIYPGWVYDGTLYTENNLREGNSNLRIMSYNVLVEDWNEGRKTGISNPHKARIEQASKMFDFYLPDVVALQEFDGNWLSGLQEKVENPYRIVFSKGYFTSLMYNSDTVKLLDSGKHQYEAKGDSRMRYIAWGKFKKIETNEEFFVLNTHFDFGKKNEEKQKAQMKEFAEFAKDLFMENNLPVFLAGDYNAYDKEVLDKKAPNYDSQQAVELYNKFVIENKDFIVDSNYIDGINIIEGKNRKYDDAKWDHIFVTSNIKVNRFSILSNDFYTSISDHFPIYIDVEI